MKKAPIMGLCIYVNGMILKRLNNFFSSIIITLVPTTFFGYLLSRISNFENTIDYTEQHGTAKGSAFAAYIIAIPLCIFVSYCLLALFRKFNIHESATFSISLFVVWPVITILLFITNFMWNGIAVYILILMTLTSFSLFPLSIIYLVEKLMNRQR